MNKLNKLIKSGEGIKLNLDQLWTGINGEDICNKYRLILHREKRDQLEQYFELEQNAAALSLPNMVNRIWEICVVNKWEKYMLTIQRNTC